jgi:hypothetical protein
MRSFRYITGLSILLYLMSSPLTGVWYARTEESGRIVRLGSLESFIFLIVASITLTWILVLSFFIREMNTYKAMSTSIIICIVSMLMFDLAVVICAIQGLMHNFNLGDADFILFLAAAPSTVLFIFGLFVFLYCYNEKLGADNNP